MKRRGYKKRCCSEDYRGNHLSDVCDCEKFKGRSSASRARCEERAPEGRGEEEGGNDPNGEVGVRSSPVIESEDLDMLA